MAVDPYDDADAEDYRCDAMDERRLNRCECGYPDWPGRCPGHAFCPCCRLDEAEDDDDGK